MAGFIFGLVVGAFIGVTYMSLANTIESIDNLEIFPEISEENFDSHLFWTDDAEEDSLF